MRSLGSDRSNTRGLRHLPASRGICVATGSAESNVDRRAACHEAASLERQKRPAPAAVSSRSGGTGPGPDGADRHLPHPQVAPAVLALGLAGTTLFKADSRSGPPMGSV